MQGGFYDRAGTWPLTSFPGTPSTCLWDQEPCGNPKLTDWAEEKEPLKHTRKTKYKTITITGNKQLTMEKNQDGAVSRKSKENSFQKDWLMIFNAVQQPSKINTDHCPLFISDFNKGSFQGNIESRSEIFVG